MGLLNVLTCSCGAGADKTSWTFGNVHVAMCAGEMHALLGEHHKLQILTAEGKTLILEAHLDTHQWVWVVQQQISLEIKEDK